MALILMTTKQEEAMRGSTSRFPVAEELRGAAWSDGDQVVYKVNIQRSDHRITLAI